MDKYLYILACLCLKGSIVSKAETECKTTADIVFMVDSSTSIREFDDTRDNWQIIKDFIVNITKQLPVREDAIRIGVVKFSNKVDTQDIIFLGQYSNKDHLKTKINDLRFVEGGTNTSGVIRHIYKDPGFFGQGSTVDRPNVQNFGILITDGLSNIDSNKTKPEARIARLDHKIKIFTIGITKYANVDELQEIASDPVSHYHYLSQDFRHLNLLIDDLILGLCRAKPPPSAPCANARADITFVLDSSGSIGQPNWLILKQFVVAVMNSLDLENERTRVAVVRYSTFAEVVFPLNKYFGDNVNGTLADMRSEVMKLEHLDERTNISGALRMMRQHVFTEKMGDRPDIKNIGILISDGKSTDEINRTMVEARLAKEADIRMFALGLTTDIDSRELQTIASSPLADHYLNTTSVADVVTLQSRLIWGVCNDKCQSDINSNPDCWRNVSYYGCGPKDTPQWVKFGGHILLGHNYDRLENIITPEECQRLCYKDPDCRSIDYVARYRQCAVSYVTKAEVPHSFVVEESADYFELTCPTTTGAGPTAPGDTNGSTRKTDSSKASRSVFIPPLAVLLALCCIITNIITYA